MTSAERAANENEAGLDAGSVAATREDQLADLRSRIATVQQGRVAVSARAGVQELDVLQVPGPLAAVFPGGGIARGVTTTCARGSVQVGILAAVTAAGRNAAVVGGGQLGLLAVHEHGGELSRLACVSDPGPNPLTIVAALAEGLDLVVLDVDDLNITATQARILAGKVRTGGCALLVTGRRIRGLRSRLDVAVRAIEYDGIGRGRGRLQAIRLDVRTSGPAITRPWNTRLRVVATGAGSVRWERLPTAPGRQFSHLPQTG